MPSRSISTFRLQRYGDWSRPRVWLPFPGKLQLPLHLALSNRILARWHISLSTWFRDYVYIPLGGNRVSTAKWLRNIFIVWTLTGLWHGAAWNFVFWGLFFGVLLVIERFFC